jgi:beta-fructofuranosidase
MLRLADAWTWDFWLAKDGDAYHVFFLRASRALSDPHRRHWRAGIGHAVSHDLRNWTLLPDALVHADPPAFDDLATWTGSVVRAPDGSWRAWSQASAWRFRRPQVCRAWIAHDVDWLFAELPGSSA